MYAETYQKLSLSVAGIGYGNPPEFTIMGSGFLLHDGGIIATNWHVAEALLTKRDDQIMIRSDACAVFFIRDPEKPENEWVRGMLAVPIVEIGVPPDPTPHTTEAPLFRGLKPDEIVHPDKPDVSLLKVDFERVPKQLRGVPPVERVVGCPLRVGQEVAICGFPQGLNFPAHYRTGDKLQLTPLLQIGHISGVLPFDGVPVPSEYVLDIPVNGGSSGSPLFTPDGTIVGIVYAARMGFSPLTVFDPDTGVQESWDSGVYVPTSLGLAVPATRFPREMTKE